MSLKKIYNHSPIPVQNMMTSVAGYHRNQSRYGGTYWRHRRWLEEFDTWSYADKLAYQEQTLVHFVRDAVESSQFYSELYAGIDVERIQNVEDLKLLPLVDKETLRARMSTVYTVAKRGAVVARTGGTTGKSLVVRQTKQDMMIRMAQLDHFKHRCGFEHRKMRRATFSGNHIIPPAYSTNSFWRYNAACKQMLYSTFHITDANLPGFVESLNRFRPDALDGFFSSMVAVANYIERNDMKLTFQPVAIFPTSETVTESGRAQLERVFGARVFNQYASSEGAPFVTECPHGTLHVEMSSGIFESLDDEILVTSFTTHGTPLIRYRIGDSMVFGNAVDCGCGISSAQMLSISGRQDDFLYRADGAKVNAGNVANLFKYMPNALIKAQLVQKVMHEVTALLVVDVAQYRIEYDDLLRKEFESKFGTGTRLTVRHVADIPGESSGKYRLIKNSVGVGATNG